MAVQPVHPCTASSWNGIYCSCPGFSRFLSGRYSPCFIFEILIYSFNERTRFLGKMIILYFPFMDISALPASMASTVTNGSSLIRIPVPYKTIIKYVQLLISISISCFKKSFEIPFRKLPFFVYIHPFLHF